MTWEAPARADMTSAPELVHGTAIALGRRAAILLGPSGSGKSDLALRCLLHPASPLVPEAAVLIADDQVLVERHGGVLFARAPEKIRGLLEVRGMGVIQVPFPANGAMPIFLLVELSAAGGIDRLPDTPPAGRLAGVTVPLLRVSPWEASAPGKVLLALARAGPPGS